MRVDDRRERRVGQRTRQVEADDLGPERSVDRAYADVGRPRGSRDGFDAVRNDRHDDGTAAGTVPDSKDRRV